MSRKAVPAFGRSEARFDPPRRNFFVKIWKGRALTCIVAALGVGVFFLLGLPLPFLLGPMFACLIAALFQMPVAGFGLAGDATRTILGVAVGASIKPELFDRVGDMAFTLALTPLFVILIGLVGYPYFRRFCGFSKPTAYFSAMPGGLQDMIVFGEEAGADVRALTLVHATRVLVIVSVAPFLMEAFYGVTVSGQPAPGVPLIETPLVQGLIMVACALIGWRGGKRIGLFGASIVGPLILAGIASLSGVLVQRPPMEAIIVAQLFLGAGVGVKYVGATLRELRSTILASLGFCVLLGLIAFSFETGITLLGLAPPLEAFLSFAPGGQAEMALLALVAGADVAFVVSHHLVRIVVVILGAPLVARKL